MPISFNDIPSSARTPFTFIEFDASRAQQSPGVRRFHALIIGQRRTTDAAGDPVSGTVAELIPTQFTREEQVAAAWGPGSMIHEMARAFFAQRPNATATFIAIDDPDGDKAEGSVEFAVSSPQSGTIAVYVAGRRYAIPCSTSSTATTLGAALAAAISADTWAAVTASATAGVVTLTALHAGVAAGAIDVRHSHAADEALPLGVTVTVTAMADGTGAVAIADAIAVMPADEQYHVCAHPYVDSTNLTALEAELADRYGPERQIGCLAFAATAASHGTAQTLGNSRNSPHSVIASCYGSPSPTWAVAAAIAGTAARAAAIDPARPFQTLELAGLVAPTLASRFNREERDILLTDGIATLVVNAAGNLAIERLITTYQTSPQGAADTAYLDATTLFTLDLLRYELRTMVGTKYPRHKLANDGTRYAVGQAIMTPKVMRAELLALARSWEERGLIEGVEQFKADLIVERNANDPNRLDVYLPPDLVNGLRVVAAQVGFRL